MQQSTTSYIIIFVTWFTDSHVLPSGADVNRHTSSNDHSVLSLSCAGGHVNVVQYLLMQGAEPTHTLRVSSATFVYESHLYSACSGSLCGGSSRFGY